MLDYVIIDPSYAEFNRGSFGYLPYILHCGLTEVGKKGEILEDFTISQLKAVPKAKHYYIALWAYPQIEICQVLNKFLEGEFSFFGYYPLIDKMNFKKYIVPNDLILNGIKRYPKYYWDFKHILLCDDDQHLVKYEDGSQVYPLFTAYGCPNGCTFCPATVNCNYKRIEVPLPDILDTLDYCNSKGYKNIHFTDEDFFHNTKRTFAMLEHIYDKGMKFIALATVNKVLKFLETYGEEPLIRSGVKIIEVGFETADETIAKNMHKQTKDKYVKLVSMLKETNLFWLTLTFFPGETISSLNKTGKFLKQYGYKFEEVCPRIATNSTEGGLGQFMQVYDGTADFDFLQEQGIHLTQRPLRLLPSFIPFSFLSSKIKKVNEIKEEHKKWFDLYRVDPNQYKLEENKVISDLGNDSDFYIFCAICARLGIIEGE